MLSLGDALVANHTLTALDLSRNRRIDAEAVGALSVLLAQNRGYSSHAAPRAGGDAAPPKLVAPNEHARRHAAVRVQSLFGSALAAAAPMRRPPPPGPRQGQGRGAARSGAAHRGAAWGGGDSPPAVARATREHAARTEAAAELHAAQSALGVAGERLAELRHKEARLERALREAVGARGASTARRRPSQPLGLV